MTINQFALYRVNKMTAGRKLWHLSYNEAREKKAFCPHGVLPTDRNWRNAKRRDSQRCLEEDPE